jgi:hypothetical protein
MYKNYVRGTTEEMLGNVAKSPLGTATLQPRSDDEDRWRIGRLV